MSFRILSAPIVSGILVVMGLWGLSTAQGSLVIDPGTQHLQANQANQAIQLYLTSSSASDTSYAVAGLELDVQIGDGGGDLGGVMTGPTISHIDLTSGTLLGVASATQSDVVAFPMAAQSTVDIVGTCGI